MDLFTEIGVREWLIGAGLLLVLAVLVDGFRRMRAERSGGIKMSLGMGGGFADDGTAVDSPELPNGGARVIVRTDPIISDQGPDDLFYEDDATELEGNYPEDEASQARQAAFAEREILVMHVRAKAEDGFNGSDLLQILLACDMRYGEKDILHRHEKAEGKGCLQFSVANMLEPGTFNLEDINSFRTPGVTFFMTLPGPEEPMQAFDCMLETANCLVKNLDARLLDEEHSTASLQVVNHYRERIKQFDQKMNNALDGQTETV